MLGQTASTILSTQCLGNIPEITGELMALGYYESKGHLIGKKKDGTEFPLSAKASVIKNQDGEIIARTVSFLDLSEEYQHETEVTQAVNALFNSSGDSLLVVDREITILRCNQKGAERFKRNIGELVGMRGSELFTPEVYAARQKIVDDVFATGDEKIHEDQRDGRFFKTHYIPLKNKQGVVESLLVSAREITEQKQTELGLSEKNRLAHLLLDAFPCVALLLDPRQGKIILANQKALLTYGHEQHKGPWLLPPEVWQARVEKHEEIKAAGTVWEAHWLPLADDYYMHYAFDISEKKALAKSLAKSEKYYQHIFALSNDGILIADAETGKFVDANNRIGTIFGYTMEEFLSLSMPSIHPEKNLPELHELFHAMARGELRFATNLPCLKKDGSIFYADLNAMALEVNEQKLMVGFFRDVTERRAQELEIRRSHDRLEQALENSGQAWWEWDIIESFTKASASWWKMMGLPGDTNENAFPVWLESMHPDDRNMVLKGLEDAMTSGVSSDTPYRSLDKSGRVRWFRSRGRVIEQDEEGKPLKLAGMIQDITAEKKHEDELLQAKHLADAANKAKSTFLANMSHELRTPMNGVLGLTQLLQETALNDLQQEYLSDIKQCGESLTNILGDILSLATIEAGKLTLHPRPFRLEEIFREIQLLFRSEASRKNIAFHLKISEAICDHQYGDPLRIKQILINLVGNAIKFTHQGSVTLRASSECSKEVCILNFSIEDTGIGIAENRQQAIFQAFEQADMSMTRNYGGTGLGLAIVDQLLKLMQGTITLNSIPGEGSVFHVSLPLARSPSINTEANEAAPEFHPNRKDLQILVVDDEEINLRVMSSFAAKMASLVASATSGQEALGLFDTQHFDVVFMDVKMPGLDGIETTKRIRQFEEKNNRPASVIIAVTAHALEEDRERCLQAGMDDYIAKPVGLAKLQLMVAKHLPEHFSLSPKP